MLPIKVDSRFLRISNFIGIVAWTLSLAAYFFQFPFSWASRWILPCFFVFLATQIANIRLPENKILRRIIAIYIIYLCVEAIRSVVLGVSFGRIARFFVILLLIPLCCMIRPKFFKRHLRILTYLATIKAILLIVIAFNLLVVGNHEAIRAWVTTHNRGDIYLLHGLPYVQVHGNALLMVAFMVDCMHHRRLTKQGALILVGILCAGNFAFILGLGGFAAYSLWAYLVPKIKAGEVNLRKLIITASICAIPAIIYFIYKIIEKSSVSNVVRLDQIKFLLDTNLLWGRGLGSIIEVTTSIATYSGDIYFELQTLYIINQIGFVGIALYFFISLHAVSKRGKSTLIVYLLYLLYSFWNPYCFDATHLISCFAILNMLPFGGNDDQSSYYYLLPGYFRGKKRINHKKPG